MADLVLTIRDNAGRKDGDPFHPWNDRSIRQKRIEDLVSTEKAKNPGSFKDTTTLLYDFYLRFYEFRVEHFGDSFLKITQATGEVENVTDLKLVQNMGLYIARRKEFGKVPLFLESNKTICFGGNIGIDLNGIEDFWNVAEGKTTRKRKDFQEVFYNTPMLKNYLVLDMQDFDDDRALQIIEKKTKPHDDGKGGTFDADELETKRTINWQADLGIGRATADKIRDKSQKVEVKRGRQYNINTILESKP